MIWYMEANRKIKSYSYWIVFKRKKTLKKTFYLVIYYNHILKCLKTQTNCGALFYHESKQQKRTPQDSIKSFILSLKTSRPFSFAVNDTTLPSDNPLRFRKNLL